MFKAVIKNKSAGLNRDIENESAGKRIGIEVSSVREDVLTAAVFSRLSYLPAPVFWRLLCDLFHVLPRRQLAELKTIEFWPSWDHPSKDRMRVEPDVFLQFNIGDPTLTVDLLIEMKRYEDWSQYAGQHIDQLKSYFYEDEGESVNLEDKGEQLYFLALGGLGKNPQTQMDILKEESLATFKNTDESKFNKDHIGGASWTSLSNLVQKSLINSSGHERRILSDIFEILTYAGFRKRTYFSDEKKLVLPDLSVENLNQFYKASGE